MRTMKAVARAVSLALLAAGCGSSKQSLPQGAERVKLKPADFTANIDNPYWPMRPGSHWVYRETSASGRPQRIDVTVTRRTRLIDGIPVRVVHDRATEGKRVVEDTHDWYAQDRSGNVWYLGEATTEYPRGEPPSTEGSWQAGVRGAEPGVLIPGNPRPGMHYRQEHAAGHAEDAGRVLSLAEQAQTPAGLYRHALLTAEWTPLEPKLFEHKVYARGVGPVLELTVSGGSDRAELLSFRKGG